MISKESRTEIRRNKHRKIRNRFSGTAERPRLCVFRSNNHMYAQIIDDTVGNTLVSASTLQKDVKAELSKTNNVEAAAHLGTVIAKKALEKVEGVVKADVSHTSGTAVVTLDHEVSDDVLKQAVADEGYQVTEIIG